MITESIAANIALNIAHPVLFRFMSFHALRHAIVVLLLGMVTECTAADRALAMRYLFLFRSLAFAKANGWCLVSSRAIIELLPRVLSE